MNILHFFPCSCVQPGSKLKADDGFTCIEPDAIVTVVEDSHGLYVPCDDGKHYLCGQLSDDETYYIGFLGIA